MTTIAAENRKTLRQALRVECGFNETSDTPISIEPIGSESEYDGIANIDCVLTVTLMDLAGDGFLNDGAAVPMETETDTYRYGYVSAETAIADGSFLTPFGVTIEAANNWDHVTLEITIDGVYQHVVYNDLHWSGGKTTVYVNNGTPGRRAFITGVYLGKYWGWDNDSLISVNLDLRSVSTAIGGELEASTIEINAYEPEDVTDIIGYISKGAPIWYSAGYDGDMSEKRRFYLSDLITWKDNVLTITGQDSTMFLDNKSVITQCRWGAGTFDVAWWIYNRVKKALEDITYDEVGSANTITGNDQILLFEEMAARTIISDYTNIFRDTDYVCITYVDAGIPKLYLGSVGNTWTIYDDEIADLTTSAEQNINEIDTKVATYNYQYNGEVTTIEATAGATYTVDLDPPLLPGGNISVSPAPTSLTVISPKVIKFVAASTTTYTVSGFPIYESLPDSDDPYKVTEANEGVSYEFQNVIPSFDVTAGSITKLCLPSLLDRSNIVYEFTYRGNPHIQPRDTINVQIATWKDVVEVLDGLYPALDLYPAADLYPNAVYKNTRKMFTEWVTMTVDSISLEHSSGGGLTSKITARRGAV